MTVSENVFCQVASRRVIQVEAIFMLLFGMIGKFGALFVTIPEPVIGGVFLVMFGEYILLLLLLHTHTFNGPFSGTTRVSRYQKGKNQSGFY